MNKFEKFNIIKEAQTYGVSKVCRKYQISRTIYYRWLNRYKEHGLEGLDTKEKDFTPVNKTKKHIEEIVLNLIRSYPTYGPRAIKYLLDDIGYSISESAVYNIMNRHSLTKKEARKRFARRTISQMVDNLLPFKHLALGECWIFWSVNIGEFDGIGNVYKFTLLDVKSRIACSRLYTNRGLKELEDLLAAVALPVAQTLSFDERYLCFYDSCALIKSTSKRFSQKISHILHEHGVHINAHILENNDDLPVIQEAQKHYNDRCLSFLLPYLQYGHSLDEAKIAFQQFVRSYNLEEKQSFAIGEYSPVEHYSQITKSNLILPLWAYIDRAY